MTHHPHCSGASTWSSEEAAVIGVMMVADWREAGVTLVLANSDIDVQY